MSAATYGFDTVLGSDGAFAHEYMPSRKGGDYSGYLNDLCSYCSEYGFDMPSVKGSDYRAAQEAWRHVDSQWQSSYGDSKTGTNNEPLDLIPIVHGKNLEYVNRTNGQSLLHCIMLPNGQYEIRTPSRDYLTMFGGRGEIHTILNRLADGDFWNEAKG
jgi:hypothetical protein